MLLPLNPNFSLFQKMAMKIAIISILLPLAMAQPGSLDPLDPQDDGGPPSSRGVPGPPQPGASSPPMAGPPLVGRAVPGPSRPSRPSGSSGPTWPSGRSGPSMLSGRSGLGWPSGRSGPVGPAPPSSSRLATDRPRFFGAPSVRPFLS